MTALESRFEEELTTSIPHWHSELEAFDQAKSVQKPQEMKQDKITEESMILGV
jgi:hypothetical protein